MGKTTACTFLEAIGCRIVDTDRIARRITEPDGEAYSIVVKHFGREVLDREHRIDRAVLADIVFRDLARRRELESILHPRIRAAWRSEVGKLKDFGTEHIVVVIPLLFETRAESEFEEIVCVACSAQTQTLRLLARGWALEHCAARVQSQLSIERKMDLSSRVIWTDVPLTCVERQCLRLFGA